MTTYSEKPLRILGLTVLLSISEHIVPFCPQKVYKRYTSSIHQGTLRRKYAKKTTLHLTVVRRDLAHNMNVGVIERRLIDELDDDTDESIEGSPRRISAPEMNNHLRVSAERNGVDLGPRKDLAASLAGPYLAAPYVAEPYLAEPYLGHKKRADSSGRENTFVADKVRELDDSAADSRPDLPCKLDMQGEHATGIA